MTALPSVPVSIHEKIPQKHARSDAPDDVMDAIVEATKLAREMGEQARSTTEAVMADAMAAPAARQQRARNAGFALLERATKRIDATRAAAQRVLDDIAKRTAGPPSTKDAATMLAHQELRGVLRSMNDTKRSQAIADAIENNDQDVLAAFLHGNPLTTGATPTEREMRRQQWAKRHHADDLDRAVRITAASKAMDHAAALLIGFITDLTDQSEIDRAVAAAAKADAAIKAAVPAAA